MCLVCNKPNDFVSNSILLPFHSKDARAYRPEQLSNLYPDSDSINSTCDENWSALHHACMNTDFSVVRELVELGADVNKCTNKGYTPLHFAIQSRSVIMVDYLLSKGAQVNDVATYHEKMTPLHFAAELELKRITELLLTHNADANAENILGRTPLHLAAKAGNCEIASCLIDKGASLRKLDKHGWSARQVAEFYQHFEFSKLLVQYAMIDTNEKQFVFEELPTASWHGPEWDSIVGQFHEMLREEREYGNGNENGHK